MSAKCFYASLSLILNYQLSIINYQLSIINCQFSIINYQLINYRHVSHVTSYFEWCKGTAIVLLLQSTFMMIFVPKQNYCRLFASYYYLFFLKQKYRRPICKPLPAYLKNCVKALTVNTWSATLPVSRQLCMARMALPISTPLSGIDEARMLPSVLPPATSE